MPLRNVRDTVILAKVESVYATDPTPTAALNAILCSKPSIKPLN